MVESPRRSLAAVLAAGASGAWVGTRLAACPEALTGEPARQAMIGAAATDTRVTRVFDVAAGLPWPQRYPSRVLADEFVTRWTGREESLAADPVACVQPLNPVDAGQSVGMVRDDAPAAEVIGTMCTGAQQLLARWG